MPSSPRRRSTPNPDNLVKRGAWFGFLAAGLSGVGQTFFIGLFGDAFRGTFVLSDAAFGSLYGAATLVSGISMFWLGGLADRLVLSRAISLSVGLLAAGSVLIATATTALQLGIALFLLRLGGQGLTGHFALVAAMRFGGQYHGRSIATASMGFIASEAIFPLVVTAALGWIGWRVVWMAVPVLLLIGFLPVLRGLSRPLQFTSATSAESASTADTTNLRRRDLLKSRSFLSAIGVVLVPPFVVTAIFLHQSVLGSRLGWTPESVARAFVGFAVCRAVTTLLAGRIVDHFGARALMRFYLLPLAAGLLATPFVASTVSVWVLFAGLGLAMGGNSVVAGAIWVEVFGKQRLGLIRGMYAALMVIATATSPVLLGGLLSADVGLLFIFLPICGYAAIMPWLLAPLIRSRSH